MTFSFWDNSNSNFNKLNIQKKTNWIDIANRMNNAKFNSIWRLVDNGDGIVQKKEINMLNKLLEIADKSIDKTKGNKTIENEEFAELTKKILDGTITKELDKKTAERITQNLAKLSWSEGVDRRITKINIAYSENDEIYSDVKMAKQLHNELKTLGKELGFDVENLQTEDYANWIEDYGIRRADRKMLFMSDTAADNMISQKDSNNVGEIIKRRSNISTSGQGGAVIAYINKTNGSKEVKTARFYKFLQQKLEKENTIVTGKSYLEGGNVLNTTLVDGTPAAVVGSESIGYTLLAMGLENNEKNIEIAKNQIAQDLGIKPENIAYIPQFDFHIDMYYRPLQNGVIAVPDYQEGIKLLEKTSIARMPDGYLEKKILIEEMKNDADKTKTIREEAEQILLEKGYKIVKIPYFSKTFFNSHINYMNGIGGTSKDGKTYYITNKSDYDELDEAVKKYFQNTGIDEVYFVSTRYALLLDGGIDCLTQEE